MPSYVDLNTLHNPTTSTAPPATWGDQARDNDQYLYERGPYICTSTTRPGSPFEGQLIYETDTNRMYVYSGSAWSLLPILNTPRAFVTRTASQSITLNTITAVSFTATDLYDTDAMHDPASNASRITLPFVGLWEVKFGVIFAATAANSQGAWVSVNTAGAGTGTRYGWVEGAASNVGRWSPVSGVQIVTTAATDYIEVFVFSSTTTTIGATTVVPDNFCQVRYLGPVY